MMERHPMQCLPFAQKLSSLLGMAMLLGLVSCGGRFSEKIDKPAYDNPVKIAVFGAVAYDRAWQDSFNFSSFIAAEEINRNGGLSIHGVHHDLELVFVDDGASASQGVAAARAAYDQGIRWIVGPTYSSVTLGADPVYSPAKIDGVADFAIQNHMLMLTIGTSPKISDLVDNDLVWRVDPSDALQAQVGADYIYKAAAQGGLEIRGDVAVIYRDDSWGLGVSQAFVKAYETYPGCTVTNRISYPASGSDSPSFDFIPYLTQLFVNQPRLIYLVGFQGDVARMTFDMVRGNFLAAYGSHPPKFFSSAGVYASSFLVNSEPRISEGMMGTQPMADTSSLNFIRFRQNFQNRFGFLPLSYSENGYDSVYCMAYGMQKAQSLDPDAIKLVLQGLTNGSGTVVNVNEFAKGRQLIGADGSGSIRYEGASGPVNWDAKGDPTSATYELWIIQGGAFHTITQVHAP